MSKTERLIPCPRCRKPLLWDKSNPARPFCSRRCQLLDLNAWIEEEHRIPGEAGMDEQAGQYRPGDD